MFSCVPGSPSKPQRDYANLPMEKALEKAMAVSVSGSVHLRTPQSVRFAAWRYPRNARDLLAVMSEERICGGSLNHFLFRGVAHEVRILVVRHHHRYPSFGSKTSIGVWPSSKSVA